MIVNIYIHTQIYAINSIQPLLRSSKEMYISTMYNIYICVHTRQQLYTAAVTEYITD